MASTLDVIFENGVFRPLVPTDIPEGKRLKIRMELEPEQTPEDILALAADVYKDLPAEEIDEVEKIAFSRNDFFADRSRR
jgi:predicted DNA-binding antitoxin AbrB/MazE fold protein